MRLSESALTAGVLGALGFGLGWVLAKQEPAPDPVDQAGTVTREALARQDPLARVAALMPVLRGLRPDQIDEVAGAFEERLGTGVIREPSYPLLIEALVAADPNAALAVVLDWPADALHGALGPLMRAWARRDPEAARAAAARFTDRRMAAAANAGVLQGWAESGDRGVWIHVANLEPGMDQSGALGVLMRAVVRRDGPARLLEIVEDLPDDAPGRFKLAAFRSAGALVVRLDPELAVAFAQRHAGGEYDNYLVMRIGEAWAFVDGPAAVEWLTSLPEGEERSRAFPDTLRRWLMRDREAALAWMRERRDDPAFAPGLRTYVLAEARDVQLPTLTWLAGLPEDSELRNGMMLELGKWWMRKDPDAAQPWLEEHGIYAQVAEAIERDPFTERRRAAQRRRDLRQRAMPTERDPAIASDPPPPS